MAKHLVFFVLLFTDLTAATAQEAEEQILNYAAPGSNPGEVFDQFSQFYQNPLDLNSATREDLEGLYILSERQINHLLNHIRQTGPLLSVYELQVIDGFDVETIRKIMPLVRINGHREQNKPSLIKKMKTNHAQYFFLTIQSRLKKSKGYNPETPADKRYLGSPLAIRGRYRNSVYNDYSFGFTFEKDAGERVGLFPQFGQYGFDYYSAHFSLFNRGRLKALTIGDFNLQAGQGLILGTGFRLGKSAQTITTTRKPAFGIKPYTSFSESGFFRGGAATIRLTRRIEVTGFFSRKKLDSKIYSDSTNSWFQSQLSSGLHRSLSELSSRAKITQWNLGGTAVMKIPEQGFSGGISLLNTHFSLPFLQNRHPYQAFNFTGKDNLAGSIFYSWHHANFNFFGEAGMSAGGGNAIVSGLICSLNPKVDVSLLYRNYTRNFHSFYGNSFSENNLLSNEKGMYQGIHIHPFKGLELSAYLDVFRFPWLRYRVNGPSRGLAYLLNGRYNFNKTTFLQVRFRNNNHEQNTDSLEILRPLVGHTRQQTSAVFSAGNGRTCFTSRVNFTVFKNGKQVSKGICLAQDISGTFERVSLTVRFALFNTADYNSRTYMYEKDVLYHFSMPAYFGKGFRNILVVKFRLMKQIDLWIKAARSVWFNQLTVGSGYNQTAGPAKNTVKLQLRWKL